MHLLRSFRFRMAALATCLSGVVLLAFGAYAWFAVERISLARIDDQARDLAERQLMHPPRAPYWDRVEEAMALLFPQGDQAYLLFAKGFRGEVLYRSPNWPTELAPDRFPDPEGPPPGPANDDFHRGPPEMPPGGPRGRGFERGPGRGGPPPIVDAALYERFTWTGPDTTWRFAVVTSPHATVALGLNLNRFNAQSRQ
ncbi:MAG: hypothetical protein IT368_10345, partial [Candidatus Hydrogenedentes bacterium]|nr:hypothetical protein [Candidatus Hydrogenedentota bacterium]